MNDPKNRDETKSPYNTQPFRRAVFRGLGLILPPLMTIVILLWLAKSVQDFVITPVEWGSRRALVWYLNETKTEVPADAEPDWSESEEDTEDGGDNADSPVTQQQQLDRLVDAINRLENRLDETSGFVPPEASDEQRRNERSFLYEDTAYVQLENGEWIPEHIRNKVNEIVNASGEPLANATGKGYYDHYVQNQILKKRFVIPVFFAGFILLMYLLGKYLAAGVGRYFWNAMESVINQLPIIRTVYSSVKQVTDFFVGESDIDFQRVVACEYPRKGIWSVGFVTGESLLTIRGAADGEPVVSILMPTSPVPGTGFTVTVRKSETIDLDIPIDQALQFVVSCGVVIPEMEGGEEVTAESIQRAIGDQTAAIAVD